MERSFVKKSKINQGTYFLNGKQSMMKVSIPFTSFQMVEYITKKGVLSEHPKPVEKERFLHKIVTFAKSILPKFINDWNHLCHYTETLTPIDNFDDFCFRLF